MCKLRKYINFQLHTYTHKGTNDDMQQVVTVTGIRTCGDTQQVVTSTQQ